MPILTRRIPGYRHYKPKDLAVVRIDGKDSYLGKYNSPESREKYDRLIAEWLANGRHLPCSAGEATTEVCRLSVTVKEPPSPRRFQIPSHSPVALMQGLGG